MVVDIESVNGVSKVAGEKASDKKEKQVAIKPLKMETIQLRIVGTAPYVQLRFSEKARAAMRAKMAEGSKARSRNKEARDFDGDFQAAMYLTDDDRHGIPASSFRNAAIDACRLAGFPMTKAKCSIFSLADDADRWDGTPLVYIDGTPVKMETTVRNATGVADIRVRARWDHWSATITITYDADQFSAESVVNLIARAGVQIGIGEGRPFSKSSNGMGFGTFRIERG